MKTFRTKVPLGISVTDKWLVSAQAKKVFPSAKSTGWRGGAASEAARQPRRTREAASTRRARLWKRLSDAQEDFVVHEGGYGNLFSNMA